MLWPRNLVACALLNILHAENEEMGLGCMEVYLVLRACLVSILFWSVDGLILI